MDGLGLRGSAEAGALVFSLHSADPWADGNRSTHQVAYAGYAPVLVARGAQSFDVSRQAGVGVRAALLTDVDFGKNGVVVEVQFSNYPFLLNNTQRSDLFYRAQTVFHGAPTGLVIIVTKAGMFPSSNSTLYYEQALNQLTALAQHAAFTVPIRLVGLFESVGRVQATWTSYSAARYSRTVGTRELRPFIITNGRAGRCKIDPEITLDDL
jgi:hypothetical protein